ncbi:MAG TPA: T9SS type A sorting domain-containing protein, partial [Bacteroidia bacterium]|nr:T9SS type A sorting domain-containing protein [Bacteroidia bacterium]
CYFTPLCTETYCNVPSNWWGHQYAHTGKAYAGIYTYVSDTCKHCPAHNKNLRNYMQDSLAYSLKAFVKYYVVFYVCPADTSWFYCNNIGAYFSDSSLIYNDSVKSYLTPQVANNPLDNPLTIAKTWIKVSGSFVAAGGEKYIVIGNFKNDTASDIIYKGEVSMTEPDAFYYIDDVIVTTDSTYADSLFTGVNELKGKSEEVKVFPNPGKGVYTFEVNSEQLIVNSKMEVYNMLGIKVKSEELKVESNVIDLTSQPAGIYLYRILSEKGGLISSGKLIIQ